MRILVTNDDSVSASQLVPLIKWCKTLGEVTVVVPKFEQSAKSHSIELIKPFEVTKRTLADGIEAWVADSSPADCVRFAFFGLKEEYDLVISGINRGFNIGSDILYSGTLAATMEAALMGVKAIALSTPPEYYEHAVEHLDKVWEFVCENKLLEINDTYNINIPPMPKGFKITHQGGRYYSDDYENVGGDMYMAVGKCVHENGGDLTLDTDAAVSGYISVLPVTVDKTKYDIFEKLSYLNK